MNYLYTVTKNLWKLNPRFKFEITNFETPQNPNNSSSDQIIFYEFYLENMVNLTRKIQVLLDSGLNINTNYMLLTDETETRYNYVYGSRIGYIIDKNKKSLIGYSENVSTLTSTNFAVKSRNVFGSFNYQMYRNMGNSVSVGYSFYDMPENQKMRTLQFDSNMVFPLTRNIGIFLGYNFIKRFAFADLVDSYLNNKFSIGLVYVGE
jgi:hypothetical protein